mgnify:CR=1 FL=1
MRKANKIKVKEILEPQNLEPAYLSVTPGTSSMGRQLSVKKTKLRVKTLDLKKKSVPQRAPANNLGKPEQVPNNNF